MLLPVALMKMMMKGCACDSFIEIIYDAGKDGGFLFFIFF